METEQYQNVRDLRNTITDQDKIEMAGLGAYLTAEDTHGEGPLLINDQIHSINGKDFKIANVHNDRNTGVNYSTWTLVDKDGNPIKPIQTVFVVQGSNALPPSDERDAHDDANLANGITPEQYELTLKAFNQINAEREAAGLPKIIEVTGNSLGGGTANYIGYHTDGVNVISLNPATVPNIPKGEHLDVVSVISNDDFLNMLQNGMGYEKGGIEYTINGFAWGTENFKGKSLEEIMKMAITYGHTGYRADRSGNGYQVDDLGLSTSFLTGNLLGERKGRSGDLPVYIDANAVRNLVYSLMTKGNNQLEVIKQGLDNVNNVAETENGDLAIRTKELIDFLNKYLNDVLHGWGWILVDTADDKLKMLSHFLREVENFTKNMQKVLSPLYYLKSGLGVASNIPVIGRVFQKMEESTNKVNDALLCTESLFLNIEQFYPAVAGMKASIAQKTPELFKSVHAGNNDGIPIALKEYSQVLKEKNYPLIKAQYNNFLLTTVGVANKLEAMDSALADKLQNLQVVQVDTNELERALDVALMRPEAIQANKILSEREQQLEHNFDTFCNELAENLQKVANIIVSLLKGIRVLAECIEVLIKILKELVDLILYDLKFDKAILDVIHLGGIIEPLISGAETISSGLQSGIDCLNYLEHSDMYKIAIHIFEELASFGNAHRLVENVKPIVNLALFSENNMLAVQMSAKAALSLAKTLKEEFEGMMQEISDMSTVQGIEDLKEGSGKMAQNFQKLEKYLDILAF